MKTNQHASSLYRARSLFLPRISRRRFLQSSTQAAAILALPGVMPAWAAAGATPPSRRITVAVIGLGAMGRGHVRRVAGDPAFEVLGVCDVDATRRETARNIVHGMWTARGLQRSVEDCKGYNDFRDLLARADLDAVIIATPDHWHALMAIEAARAGKDVYCEKPNTVTIEEGRRMVQTVRRYGRVFQNGSQYRSIPTIREVCQFVREGGLGKVKHVFTLMHNLRGWLRSPRFQPYAKVVNPEIMGDSYVPLEFPLPAEPVPEGLDWDLWVGPALWHPYNRLYHTNPSPGVVPWAFCRAFGVTSLTWHLSHSADVIQYALGQEESGPVEIIHPNSGRFPTLTCRYANGTLLHLVDHWGMVKDVYHALPAETRLAGMFGGVFIGERGWLTSMTNGGPIEGGPPEVFERLGLRSREVRIGENDHHANWRECIHTRRLPSSHEEIGHRAAALGHLINIALWTGQSLQWDPRREQFFGSGAAAANRLRSRAMRAPWHL